MNDSEYLIESIIAEAAIDSRIPDGVVDLKNVSHVQVVAEVMYDSGIDEQTINEFVKKFVEEGKYPERQAFNKEGWLVTFPSKEYRDRAIKKGTHSISDPTHGKGGMNLYYKKKGKQQRQTHQDVTATDEPVEPQGQAQKPTDGTVEPPTQKSTPPEAQETPPESSSDSRAARLAKITGSADNQPASEPKPDKAGGPPSAGSDSKLPAAGDGEAPPAPTSTAPQASQPPAPPPPPPYVELSKKFAAQKAWISTPFGEWRDSQGNAVAVEALTKEIVPLKTTDREELKLFVQKHTSVA
jgi:hypothetical protein